MIAVLRHATKVACVACLVAGAPALPGTAHAAADSPAPAAAAPASTPSASEASARLRALADELYAWRLDREPDLRLARGLPVTTLQRLDEASAQADAAFAAERLPRLAAIPRDSLPVADLPLRELVELELRSRSEASRHYWLGFALTPYLAGDVHNQVAAVLRAAGTATSDEAASYVRLLGEYARVLDEIAVKTAEQRRRGILLPRPAVPGARRLLEGLSRSLPDTVRLTPERTTALPPATAARLRRDVDRALERDLLPRIARLRALLGTDYEAAAPETVGLAQYPGGREYYRSLIRVYVGTDMSPAEIHALGLRRVDELEKRLDEIQASLGFTGTRAEFRRQLRTDPRWFVRSPEELAERYTAYMKRIDPLLPKYFRTLPAAPYAVKRLDERDEPGMTYGVYQVPTPSTPTGYYRFNGSGLDTRTQIGAQHLVYHELMPGHHLQLARQRELQGVHPLQTVAGTGAYTEGWAEYAAQLGVEMGLYEPADLYGHYAMQLFLATRLVLDTGMNDLGWSLERGRAFMSEHTLEGARQIESETLRYSTDIPAQALSYALGYQRFVDLRARAERSLGQLFDVRDFHEAMLERGAVPLPVLDAQVDELVRRVTRGQASRHLSGSNLAQLVVRAPIERVWDALLHRKNWMDGVEGEEWLRGAPGVPGGRVAYTMRRPDGSVWQRIEETLLAVKPGHVAFRAYEAGDDDTRAIAHFRVSAVRGGTRVEMTVFWSDDMPELAAPEVLDGMERGYSEIAQRSIEGYLAKLRSSVE